MRVTRHHFVDCPRFRLDGWGEQMCARAVVVVAPDGTRPGVGIRSIVLLTWYPGDGQVYVEALGLESDDEAEEVSDVPVPAPVVRVIVTWARHSLDLVMSFDRELCELRDERRVEMAS